MKVTIPLVKKDSVVNRAYKFEENPFTEVYIDVNYKCNMACPMCYSDTPLGAQAIIPDLDLDYYEEFCAKLPQPIIIPMVGGEPTISKHILKIIEITHKYGHLAFMSTNGRRFAQSLDFTKQFAEVAKKGNTRIHIDISGGYNDDYNQVLYGEPGVEMKMKALENMREAKLGKVLIACVLIRGFNEDASPDVLDMAQKYKRIVRRLKFRAQGHTGRFVDEEQPYTTPEIINLLEEHIGHEAIYKDVTLSGEIVDKCLGKNCCMHFRPWRGLQIQVLEHFTRQGVCWRKGFLTNEGTIVPWGEDGGPYV